MICTPAWSGLVDSNTLNRNTRLMAAVNFPNRFLASIILGAGLLALFNFSTNAKPKRLVCFSETGQAAALYWSEQAAMNRAYGRIDKANQMEQTAAFCEGSTYSRSVAITFEESKSLQLYDSNAEFQMHTLCGLEGGDVEPARINREQNSYVVSYYHEAFRTMRYFHIDSKKLLAGFGNSRDFQCEFESYGVSDGLI